MAASPARLRSAIVALLSAVPLLATPGLSQTTIQTPATAKPLTVRPSQPDPALTPGQQAEALRISKLPLINGVPYDQPSTNDLLVDYVRDSYGLPAALRTTARTLYSEGRDKPTGWGQDFPGFAQRFGSAAAITVIDGNARLGMELAFHEDLRYLPCHRCTVKHKIENSLLAEITARHGEDGHRSFTLTPVVADFTGPIIAHQAWYPVGGGRGPMAGVVSTRLVFSTRIGGHLFEEFVIDRRKAAREAR